MTMTYTQLVKLLEARITHLIVNILPSIRKQHGLSADINVDSTNPLTGEKCVLSADEIFDGNELIIYARSAMVELSSILRFLPDSQVYEKTSDADFIAFFYGPTPLMMKQKMEEEE